MNRCCWRRRICTSKTPWYEEEDDDFDDSDDDGDSDDEDDDEEDVDVDGDGDGDALRIIVDFDYQHHDDDDTVIYLIYQSSFIIYAIFYISHNSHYPIYISFDHDIICDVNEQVRMQLGKRLEQVLMDKEDAIEQLEALQVE